MTDQNGWYQASDGRWYPGAPGYGPDPSGAGAPPAAYLSGFGPSPVARPRTWLVFVAVGVVLVGLAVGAVTLFYVSGTSRSVTVQRGFPAPVMATLDPANAVGEPAFVHDSWQSGLVTVTSVKTSARALTAGAPAPAHGQFLVVTVAATALDRLAVFPADFAAVPESGERYHPGDGNARRNQGTTPLRSSALDAKERITGTLVFDVPVGHGLVVYEPRPGTRFSWPY